MSRWLPTPLLLVLCAAGCTDPNPTFVFDAVPVVVKDGGTDASAPSTTDGGQDGGDADDASPDDAGDGQ